MHTVTIIALIFGIGICGSVVVLGACLGEFITRMNK